MDVRLLGEVQLLAAGRELDTGTPRQQAVFAALAIDPGRPVPLATLVDRVWGDDPPAEARNVLYSHLSRIRGLLRQAAVLGDDTAGRLDRRHAGYVLDVDPDRVDLHRFGRLTDQGRDPARPAADRAAALAQALSLWRGAPLAALTGDWADGVRQAWHQRRLDAAVAWARTELRLGHPDAVIAAAPPLITEYPLAEPLEALLMEALHLAGRDAEAMDRYAAVRTRLAETLGADPGPQLRALHEALLRGEVRTPPPARTVTVPAQLPPDVYGFAGRTAQLRELDAVRTTGPARPVAIDGMAGIGKTALAVHWAHRAARHFPDGQLYVNLRGFGATGDPVAPAEALGGFLDALDVPPERIPAGVPARAGLFRSLLAGRRVLILLDNAWDADQVRPLLPGAPGCLAVVTSRNRLSGLVTTAGAHPLALALPPAGEARDLLGYRIGGRRVAAEPDAVDEIVARCARLPLALAIVATRAAVAPELRLAVLAGELREAQGGLAEFDDPDLESNVRAVFSWSYRQLSPAAAELFRRLAGHPGPDLGAPAAAALAGLPVTAVRPLLDELTRAHLLERAAGRYTLHDLLRAYATELAGTLDTEPERAAARRRVLGYYVHSAYAADLLLNPLRDEPAAEPPPLPPGTVAERPAGQPEALAWFGAEYHVMLAALRGAADDATVWRLAWALTRYLSYHGRWHDSIEALSAALAAAGRLGEPVKAAFAHRYLGCAHLRLRRLDEAGTHLAEALRLYRLAGDVAGQAHTHRHQAWLLEVRGRYREALAHAEQAVELFTAAGDPAGRGRGLNAIGWFHAMLGDYAEAVTVCRAALRLQAAAGDRFGQAETWDSLGYAGQRLGRHREAIDAYRTAVALYQEFDDRYNEADSTASLGDAYHAAGDTAAARAAWRSAADLFDLIGHPGAAAVRARADA
ncbi:DNA-binding SARP family transcriptional activator [Actinoplanes octamycinicus]|uniref:DNA-binding SARP family transcriptional activator n=1 Tax=Actinoplanes octamycinicus TaxID=135948 RepID=A0A7W7M778_9ACTN|nr:BTAD domain-containing putative transcriptional regulator [Actinoplanes octamycinicus]MBB4739549.1 DNA-binding SARP family transcriptional activator [Actinoplanes octamycinicus]GIE54730.1 SARP family transcriptional regulator [Actinoplanes octamycinicus]